MFFLSSRRLHTRCALVTGVQTCALPISWTINGDTNGDGIFQDPAYIPLVNDPIVSYGSATPGQIAAFNEFIESNSYLAARRGSIAERNGDRYSWVNQLDVSFQQELPGFFKGQIGRAHV